MNGDGAGWQDKPLGVEIEPNQVLGCDLPQDAALKADGWEYRCNADGRRLQELQDTYQELGYEVRLETLDVSSLCEACGGCKGALTGFSAIYTRRKSRPA